MHKLHGSSGHIKQVLTCGSHASVNIDHAKPPHAKQACTKDLMQLPKDSRRVSDPMNFPKGPSAQIQGI